MTSQNKTTADNRISLTRTMSDRTNTQHSRWPALRALNCLSKHFYYTCIHTSASNFSRPHYPYSHFPVVEKIIQLQHRAKSTSSVLQLPVRISHSVRFRIDQPHFYSSTHHRSFRSRRKKKRKTTLEIEIQTTNPPLLVNHCTVCDCDQPRPAGSDAWRHTTDWNAPSVASAGTT